MSLKGWKEIIRREEIKPEKKKIVEKKLNFIKELIEKDKTSKALKKLSILKQISIKYNLKALSKRIEEMINVCKIIKIKDFLLEKGIQYKIIKIGETMERTKIEKEEIVISTINSMIENEEIYAEFFKSTKSLKFDKNANIKEIDNLMEAYKKWENESISKKN